MILEETKHISKAYKTLSEEALYPNSTILNEGKYLAPQIQECFECFYRAILPQITSNINQTHVGMDAFKTIDTFFKWADINHS